MFHSCVERRDVLEIRGETNVAGLEGPAPEAAKAQPPQLRCQCGKRMRRERDSPWPHYLTGLPLSSRSGTLYSRKMPVMAAWLSASSLSTTFFHSSSP